ncbi:MAG TPA: MFS transporter [Polyangia bacterium]|jgi:EmrB/QacA subfamily drug resistance transporter|nr:MFS transporter [Polyangia bacterium]
MEKPGRALLVVAVGTFLVTFDGSAVQMALPTFTRDLHASLLDSQWIMTAFLLVSTAGLLPAGRAGDLWGRARVWHAGLGLFVVGSALCATASGLWPLVGARTLQGLGAALATANSSAVLADVFPADHRGRALGLGNIAIALGLVTGPPLGGLLVSVYSWRLIFLAVLPIGVIGWLVAGRVLPRSGERPRARGSLDLAGALVSTVALTLLLVFGTGGHRWGWTAAATLATGGAGVAVTAVLVLLEGRTRQPLLDVHLFRRPMFLSGACTSLAGYAAMFTMTVAMPLFLVIGQGRSLVHAGLLVGMVPLMLSIAAPLAGWAYDKIGSRLLCAGGLAAVTMALLMASQATAETSAGYLAFCLGLVGAGLGCFAVPNETAVLNSLPEERLGVGAATLGVMRNLGMTLGVAVAATLFDWGLAQARGAAGAVIGNRVALLFGACVGGAGSLAAALRPSEGRSCVRAPASAPVT